ncbi:MAG: hypothetical protein ABW189_06730 [Rickettsiales bacterium]
MSARSFVYPSSSRLPGKGAAERAASSLFASFFLTAAGGTVALAEGSMEPPMAAAVLCLSFFSVVACFCAAFAAKPPPPYLCADWAVKGEDDEAFALRRRVLIYERDEELRGLKARLVFAAAVCGLAALAFAAVAAFVGAASIM